MNQYQKVAQALNDAFMTNEPYHFVVKNMSVSIVPKPSAFVKHTEINYLTDEGQAKIKVFVEEKYGVTPTFHHNHCFGLYDEQGSYAQLDT